MFNTYLVAIVHFIYYARHFENTLNTGPPFCKLLNVIVTFDDFFCCRLLKLLHFFLI